MADETSPISTHSRVLVGAQIALLLTLAGSTTDLRMYGLAVPLILAGAGLGVAGVWSQRRQLRVHPEPPESGQLVTEGIYTWIRHPMYASLIWGGLGVWLLDPRAVRLLLYLGLCLVLAAKMRREEAMLRRHFPGYAAYAAHTKRILPRVI